MAAMGETEPALRGRPGGIETRSIDYVPENERHGRVWMQGPFWFLGNFQPFTVAIGFVGPLVGLSLGWTIVAAVLGILFGTLFMAAHASQGPKLGLPQMIQCRAQFGYRGVILPLIATGVHLPGVQRRRHDHHQGGAGRDLRLERHPHRRGHHGARDRAGGLRPRLAAPGVPGAVLGLDPVLAGAHRSA